MYQLLAVSSFRKDRFVAAANRFVLNVMGPHFYSETEMDLAKIVEEEVRKSSLGFTAVTGYMFDSDDLAMLDHFMIMTTSFNSR